MFSPKNKYNRCRAEKLFLAQLYDFLIKHNIFYLSKVWPKLIAPFVMGTFIQSFIEIMALESILPNLFLRKTKIFYVFYH
jgi:hypothetical protein